IDHGDVRMVERGGGAGFPKDARTLPIDRTEHLERDGPVQAQILGAEHLPHAPFAEALEDAVVGDRSRDHAPPVTARRDSRSSAPGCSAHTAPPRVRAKPRRTRGGRLPAYVARVRGPLPTAVGDSTTADRLLRSGLPAGADRSSRCARP